MTTKTRRNRNVIRSSLNLYKDQNRLLNYFGIICTVASADKYNAKININKIDGATEIRDVSAADLFDNLKIVNPNGDPDFKGLIPVYTGKGKAKSLDEEREENLQKLFSAIKEKEIAKSTN